jgi:hypothetical protein
VSKPHNKICDCGNVASVKKWGEFICMRCNEIEEMLERDNFFLKTVKPLEGDWDDKDEGYSDEQ